MTTWQKVWIGCLVVIRCAIPYNHPEIAWQTVSTKHFQIHFYDKTRSALYPAAYIAEETFRSLQKTYNYTPRDKIHISLAEYDDYTNGLAGWTEGNVIIWLPDARFDLRSNTTWLRNVITHELAHIFTLERTGFQLLDWNIHLDYATPHAQVSIGSAVPMSRYFPMWLAEGLAQLESMRMGHDCWDSRREMLLRCATIENRLRTLEEMGHFNDSRLEIELSYNHGFAFTRFLESRLGTKTLVKVVNNSRPTSLTLGSFPSFFYENTGRSLHRLYKQWADSLNKHYRATLPENPTTTVPLWSKGQCNLRPRISPDSRYAGWLTSHKDDYGRTDLIVFDHTAQQQHLRIAHAREDWCFDPESNVVFYIRSRRPNRHGSYFNDVYECDLESGKKRVITTDGRIYALSAFPDKRTLAGIRFNRGLFSLVQISRTSGRIGVMYQGTLGEPFMGVSCNRSDQNRIAVSRVVDGVSNLYIFKHDEDTLVGLSETPFQEENPYWHIEGRVYFCADYDGVYNIYSIDSTGEDLRRYSTAVGGLFSPSPAGPEELLVSEYTAHGFRIATLKSSGIPYSRAAQTASCSFQPLPTAKKKLTIVPKEYEADRLRPLWRLVTFGSVYHNTLNNNFGFDDGTLSETDTVNFAVGAGLFMQRSDPLGKKQRMLGIVFDAQRATVENSAAYGSGYLSGSLRQAASARQNWKLQQPYSSTRSHFSRESSLPKTSVVHEFRSSFIAQSEDTTSDSTANLPIIPLFIPQVSLQNRSFPPTLMLDMQLITVAFIPMYLWAQPSCEFHLYRNVYAGISPQAIIGLWGTGLQVEVPLWLSWFHEGYINEDIAYNQAGLTALYGSATPMLFSAYFIDSLGLEADTTTSFHTGIVSGAGFQHGFPIVRYGSLVVSAEVSIVKLDHPFPAESFGKKGLTDTTDVLSTYTLGLETNFPLVRTINAGSRLYADALYGKLFYTFEMYGSRAMYTESYNFFSAVVDKNYLPQTIHPAHTVGIGITMGMEKSYMFSRQLTLEVSLELLRKRFSGELIFTF
jgi:hypothetical protein